jgi:hypothetical protein
MPASFLAKEWWLIFLLNYYTTVVRCTYSTDHTTFHTLLVAHGPSGARRFYYHLTLQATHALDLMEISLMALPQDGWLRLLAGLSRKFVSPSSLIWREIGSLPSPKILSSFSLWVLTLKTFFVFGVSWFRGVANLPSALWKTLLWTGLELYYTHTHTHTHTHIQICWTGFGGSTGGCCMVAVLVRSTKV